MHDEAAGDIMMLWYYHVGVFGQPQLKVRFELEYHFNSTSCITVHWHLVHVIQAQKFQQWCSVICSCFAEFRVALCCSGFRVGSTLRLARMLLGAARMLVGAASLRVMAAWK